VFPPKFKPFPEKLGFPNRGVKIAPTKGVPQKISRFSLSNQPQSPPIISFLRQRLSLGPGFPPFTPSSRFFGAQKSRRGFLFPDLRVSPARVTKEIPRRRLPKSSTPLQTGKCPGLTATNLRDKSNQGRYDKPSQIGPVHETPLVCRLGSGVTGVRPTPDTGTDATAGRRRQDVDGGRTTERRPASSVLRRTDRKARNLEPAEARSRRVKNNPEPPGLPAFNKNSKPEEFPPWETNRGTGNFPRPGKEPAPRKGQPRGRLENNNRPVALPVPIPGPRAPPFLPARGRNGTGKKSRIIN